MDCSRDFERLWNDPRGVWNGFSSRFEKVEREPSILGASSHIMAVGRK